MAYTFAGHDTFICRNYWLKKGLDHIKAKRTFNNLAIKQLGVGKNMVGAIRYWVKAFGLNDRHSDIADFIFETEFGKDPYLEDIGTIWLLHYLLVTSEVASIYNLVFNIFRKTRLEFNREQLLNYLESECQVKQQNYSVNSLKKDISVFLNNYLLPENSKNIETDFMGMLYELELIERVRKDGHVQTFRIENKHRLSLPNEILLSCLLINLGDNNSISFTQLLNNINSVGSVFALSSKHLSDSIGNLCQSYPNKLVYKQDAGLQVLQLKEKFELFDLLNDYYGQ